MKRLLILLCVVFVLIVSPMAKADTLTVQRLSGYYPLAGGGEYTLSGNDIMKFQAYFGDSTKDEGYNPSIQSFCVELNESAYVGTTLNFVLNTVAIAGGTHGPHPDPISIGTAYLFYYFSQGTLDYDYTPGPNRVDSAYLLQRAIWWLEQEGGYAYDDTNKYMKTVFDLFGGEAGARADNNNQYPVYVLNLYKADGSLAQDMLVTVPEPATMFLLGSGLLGMGVYVRKRFKK